MSSVVTISDLRRRVLLLCSSAGDIASLVARQEEDEVADKRLVSVFKYLVDVALLLGIDLTDACLQKLSLNDRKYPVELCGKEVGNGVGVVVDECYTVSDANAKVYVKIRKYSDWSDVTGVTVANQVLAVEVSNDRWLESFLSGGLEQVALKSSAFVAERGWQEHDSETSLALAICSECGELADAVAWLGDSVAEATWFKRLDCISQELADIVIFLVRMVAVCGSDVNEIVNRYRNDCSIVGSTGCE